MVLILVQTVSSKDVPASEEAADWAASIILSAESQFSKSMIVSSEFGRKVLSKKLIQEISTELPIAFSVTLPLEETLPVEDDLAKYF